MFLFCWEMIITLKIKQPQIHLLLPILKTCWWTDFLLPLFFQVNPSVVSGPSADKYTPLGALASLQPGSAQAQAAQAAQAAAASAQLAAQQAAASNSRGFPSSAAAYQGAPPPPPHHFQQAGKTRFCLTMAFKKNMRNNWLGSGFIFLVANY